MLFRSNDVYVDDAELVIIDASGVTLPAPAAASASQSAPAAPQPAPPVQPSTAGNAVNAASNTAAAPAAASAPNRPDGALVHNVKAGDTIFGLALQYDVPMDQILQLNGLTKDSFIHIGDELIIAAPPAVTPSPEAQAAALAPTSVPARTAAATLIAQAEPSGKTQLCVRAFQDLNADGLFGGTEALLKGAVFQVADASGKTIVSYATDGESEPH